MPIVRTAVLLFAYPAGQPLNLHGDVHWYHNYFFGPAHGQAGYWIAQTDAQLVLHGQVFDWAIVSDPNPDLMNRTTVINGAIRALERDRRLNFNGFDVIVVVLGVRPSLQTDGGSTTAKSRDRKHAGIVIRVGDPFDFVAHELGHALGLNHSYGNPAYQNAPWSQPGEYGHPYCVMSANGYGGIGGSFAPTPPRDGRPEYSGLGPSVNAATALAHGWVDAHVHQLPGAAVDLELRSRHWLGRTPWAAPQALEIRAPDGKNYVVEYRENADWDRGQGSPVLIINAGRGSTGDLAHPNTHSATFLGLIRLPITFGGPGSVYNGPGFGVEILDRLPLTRGLRIRLRPGRVGLTPLKLTYKKETLREDVVGSGVTTFERGEKLCVRGTWSFDKLERREVATFEATYALAVPPVAAAWSVEDVPLAAPGGTVTLPGMSVRVANPKLEDQRDTRWVMVRYEIEAIPNGSRLRLFNEPGNETYDLRVTAGLSTAVGMGTQTEWMQFTGVEFRYPQAFYDERNACLQRFIDVGRRYVRYKILLPPDLWRRVPDRLVPRVEQVLEHLGQLHERGEALAYREVVSDLAALIGVTSVTPLILSQDERVVLNHQVVEREPHLAAPPARRRPRGALMGLLLGIVVGAGWIVRGLRDR